MVADLCVAVTATAEVRPALDALFGGCLTAGSREPDVVLELGGAAPERPEAPPDLAYDDHVALWFGDGGLVAFDRLGVGAVERRGVVRAGGDGDDRSWRLVVQYALVSAFARLGRHAVHGAGLARDGAAILALGPGGVGKSTLSYAALRRGWHVLSDDLTWLYDDPVRPGTVIAAGFAKPLAVPGELLDGPLPGARRAPDDERGRWLLPVDPVAASAGVPLVGVLEVAHSTGEGRLVPVAVSPDRLAAVLRSHPLVADVAVRRGFFPLAGRLTRLPCLQLEHDVEPIRRLDRAGQLLDDAVARFAPSAQ